jgi:DNA modification methylase
MEIIMRPIADLKNYDKNARTHSAAQIKELVDSIKIYGFLDPIEIAQDLTIISGHARLAAALELGLTHVPTICHHHLTKTLKKGYTLAANRIALSAGWDGGILKDEFTDLIEEEFDLRLTGFTQDEIDDYLNPDILNDNLTDGDDCEMGEGQEAVTQRGDVWILGDHRLRCGDSTFVDDVQALLAGNAPHLMITDPPYGVEYDPSWRDGADLGVGERSRGKVKNDNIVDWTDAYSLFEGDVAYVWHAGKFTHIVAKNLEDCGFDIVSQIIWAKQHFALSRGDYHWQHEPCWYVVRKGKKHHWRGARDQSTLWEIKNNNSFGNSDKEETWGHGTQKPIDCMLTPLENNSRANDYVYDPFGGSGTTLIACEKTGRRCLMMELDEKYCDIIVRRWQKFSGKKAILEETGEPFDGN